MSDRKTRLTISVDPRLSAYVDQLVESGKATSISAVFNDALAKRVERDRRIARRWREITAQADMAGVERMVAHVEAQVAQLPAISQVPVRWRRARSRRMDPGSKRPG